MNPLTNVKNLQKLNDRELELGIIGKKSWHDEYKDSAWVFIGGLPYDLSEGDIICVFSQYGEIVNLNLVRDHKTGKSKGFSFLCYEDQRSTVLAVDNLNGIKILGRVIRVDHVKDYKIPKEHGDEDELLMKIRNEGCAPKLESSSEDDKEDTSKDDKDGKKAKKDKKKKKKKDKKKKKRKESSSESDSSDPEKDKKTAVDIKMELKQEKLDKGYDKALNTTGMSQSRYNFSADSKDWNRPRQKDTGQDRLKRRRDSNSDDDDDNDSEDERRKRKPDKHYDSSQTAANGSQGRDSFSGKSDANSSWRNRDRSRERDKDWGGHTEREKARDEFREKERTRDLGSYRDRGRDRDRFEDGERDRSRYEDRERDRSRKDDRERGNYDERERSKTDSRDRGRDRGGYNDHDRHRDNRQHDRSRDRDRHR